MGQFIHDLQVSLSDLMAPIYGECVEFKSLFLYFSVFQRVQIRYQEQIRVGVGVVCQATIKKNLSRIIIEIIQSATITLILILVPTPGGKTQIRIRIVALDQKEISMKIWEHSRLREPRQRVRRQQQQGRRRQPLNG